MKIVIAHAGDLGTPSGGTSRVSAFARGLQSKGHEVTMVIPRPTRTLSNRLSPISLETVDVPTEGFANQFLRGLKVARRAKQIRESWGGILQFEHSTLAGLGSIVGCSQYILDMHDLAFASPHYSEKPFGSIFQRIVWEIERRGVQNARQVIVVSDQMDEMVAEEWGIPSNEIEVIPNGYFQDVISKYETQSEENNSVVFFGTLHPKVDIEAFRSIAELPEVDQLDIIGDGARREELEDVQQDLGDNSITIHGRLPEGKAYEILSRATVVINPQHESKLQRASSPVKLFDYAGMGLPIIGSAGPDILQTLQEHDAAIEVQPEEDYSEAVRSIIRDASRRKTMSTNAKELATSWTWSDRVDDIAGVYETGVTS